MPRIRCQLRKKPPSPKSPPTFPPLPPSLPPTDLGLKAISNLKKKRSVQELEEGEVALRRGLSSRRCPKTLRTRGLLLWIAGRSKIEPMCAFRNAPVSLAGGRWGCHLLERLNQGLLKGACRLHCRSPRTAFSPLERHGGL